MQEEQDFSVLFVCLFLFEHKQLNSNFLCSFDVRLPYFVNYKPTLILGQCRQMIILD